MTWQGCPHRESGREQAYKDRVGRKAKCLPTNAMPPLREWIVWVNLFFCP